MERIEQEKRTVAQMIGLYCRRKQNDKALCDECRQLLVYAHKRLDACRFGNDKPSCKKCPVHCYAPDYREKIREVMQYAGPRMLFTHPVAALRHLIQR